MESVHQLITHGTPRAEHNHIWCRYWHHLASAKVPLETKVAAYRTMRHRNVANINNVSMLVLCEMTRVDRAFVAALDLNADRTYGYRLFTIWHDDDAAAFANMVPTSEREELMQRSLRSTLLTMNAPRCIRFLLRDKETRTSVMMSRLTPLGQQLLEELVQPTDRFDRETLLRHGQSVKLIGMCVPDEELVKAWLPRFAMVPSVPFARKLHAMATPKQRTAIRLSLLYLIRDIEANANLVEMVCLFGLLGPSHPTVQAWFLKNNVDLFPAFTFAMIVAMCDGYLEVTRSRISASQSRFFDFVMRLPMDLQALVSLRLWGHTATVIRREKFDRAFLAII
jgi:hypothetical protein